MKTMRANGRGDAQPLLRKWYFCVNGQGYRKQRPLIRAAIASARANTDLTPIGLYNGEDDSEIKEIEGWGARIIRHQSTLSDVLRKGYGDLYDQYSGHWLRIDIPLLEQEDNYVLYTDIDVLFLGPPRVASRPKYLAAAPERYRWRWPTFNSGVMILNVPNMRKIHGDFVARIARRMEPGWTPPGHDQVSYNHTFRWRHAPLSHSMNWKPYWGLNPDARIVHFHGPKPRAAARMAHGEVVNLKPAQQELWKLNRAAYAHYVDLWESFQP